jgi:hypothetical protein
MLFKVFQQIESGLEIDSDEKIDVYPTLLLSAEKASNTAVAEPIRIKKVKLLEN